MSYRNKTYIIFDADTDITQYRMMQAWKANKNIDFDFYDAHKLNNLMKGSLEQTIKTKLKERMESAKQVIVIVGTNTKNLFKFVRWEMEVAIEMDLPIIAVNLNKENSETDLTPPILKNNTYFISVPYEINKIKFALDNFPQGYKNNRIINKETKEITPSSRFYNWDKIDLK